MFSYFLFFGLFIRTDKNPKESKNLLFINLGFRFYYDSKYFKISVPNKVPVLRFSPITGSRTDSFGSGSSPWFAQLMTDDSLPLLLSINHSSLIPN